MNIIVPNRLTTKALSYTTIKIAGYLFTLWRSGYYAKRVLPTSEEISKALSIPIPTVKRAVISLAETKFHDDEKNEDFPILTIETFKSEKTGRAGRLYQIYIPGLGVCDDPKEFEEARGGRGNITTAGGYFVITDEIQSWRLELAEEMALAALMSLVKANKKKEWVWHVSNITKVGIFEGRERTLSKSITSLRKKGIIVADDSDVFYKGYKNIILVDDPYELMDDIQTVSDDPYEFVDDDADEDVVKEEEDVKEPTTVNESEVTIGEEKRMSPLMETIEAEKAESRKKLAESQSEEKSGAQNVERDVDGILGLI